MEEPNRNAKERIHQERQVRVNHVNKAASNPESIIFLSQRKKSVLRQRQHGPKPRPLHFDKRKSTCEETSDTVSAKQQLRLDHDSLVSISLRDHGCDHSCNLYDDPCHYACRNPPPCHPSYYHYYQNPLVLRHAARSLDPGHPAWANGGG